jgi:hypothetical protein
MPRNAEHWEVGDAANDTRFSIYSDGALQGKIA